MALVLLTMSMVSSEFKWWHFRKAQQNLEEYCLLFDVCVLPTPGNITKVDTGFELTHL